MTPEEPISGNLEATAGQPNAGRIFNRNAVQIQLLVGILALVGLFSALFPDRFATFRNFQNITRQGATLLVVAVGQSFALVQGGFDISVGAVMGLASTVGALVMIEYGLVAGLLAGMGAGLAAGLVNGTLIAKLSVTPFVATLAMLAFARGAANQISDGASVSGLPESFRI